MPRFLPALIVLAGLLALPAAAEARTRYSPAERPLSAEERRHEWGELLILGMLAGGIGMLAVYQGARELWACLPGHRAAVQLDDYDD